MVNIIINKTTRMIQELTKRTIGNDGENLQENIIFSFDDEFVDGQARLELLFPDGDKSWITLTKTNETYTLPVKSVMTKEGKIFMQLVIDEGINENEVPIFKSNTFYLYVNESINAVEEAPDGYEQWLEIANAKLNQMDNLDIDATQTSTGATITITKKDGTQKSVEVDDGVDGTGLDYNWSGTSLGVKREDETNYQYVNLQGPQGPAGQIKFIVVNVLPTENIDTSAIYLVPSERTEEENVYVEYIYINNKWEKLGEVPIAVDLSDYYTKQETYSQSEVNTLLSGKQNTIDSSHKLSADLVDDTNSTNKFVSSSDITNWNSKLDSSKVKNANSTTAGDVYDVRYINSLIGDISSALDLINGESVGA